MRRSLATSFVLHGLVLAGALITIGAPADFEVADVESLPVDIIPVESITQIQQGDEKAPVKEAAAPVPTKKPNIVEGAENFGENDVDLKTPPMPNQRPKEVEAAAAPKQTEKPLPKQDTKPNDVKEIAKEETETAPPTEVAKAEPTPMPEVTPEPTPAPQEEAAPAEEPKPEAEALPQNVPVPAAKPKAPPKKAEEKPVETKTAEKKPDVSKDKKKADKKQEMATSASSKQSDFNADEIAALLNKQEASGGGAKRSAKDAALGGKKTTAGSKLSQSEMDALRGQIQNNWSVIPGMADAAEVRVQVRMKLDESGAIVGDPEVTATGGSDAARAALAGGARRAVLKSSPFKNLPPEKYDAWGEVIVNFDPSELL
ncbi:hypothetical protein MRS76_01345 [Rhizobiaceae bacterium n13]|uniref:Cell division and transport-associated protein TolA n=1 Tax=Ferirhizobium litorale TaxID=2927786 RepID=A0AAE3QCB3_9HYPH|nr:hypothetical protein [Fererhizobium litorale]MDI7860588.1 hypothetical protein [Fererhizobium litorale]MDI7920736.1 hypothetical protein [Fererhizobium litorale]